MNDSKCAAKLRAQLKRFFGGMEMAEPSRDLARFSSILPLLATQITCHHPDRSSNSI